MPDGEIVIVWRLEKMDSRSIRRMVLERLLIHGRAREHGSGNPPLIARYKAEKQMSRQLQLGTLAATGMEPRQRKRSPIPAESWQDLKLGPSGVRDPRGLWRDGEWKTVTVPSQDVQRLWPVTANNDSGTPGRNTRSNPGKDAELSRRINAVIAAAKKKNSKHSYRRMAELICEPLRGSFEGYSQSTVAKIISNRYPQMTRLGITAKVPANVN